MCRALVKIQTAKNLTAWHHKRCCSDYVKFKKMTIEEFNKTRFGAGMTMRLHKSDELKLIVSVDFEEALLAYLINDFDDESISWVRCENVTIE